MQGDIFEIGGLNGKITLKKPLDFEGSTTYYNLNITATVSRLKKRFLTLLNHVMHVLNADGLITTITTSIIFRKFIIIVII